MKNKIISLVSTLKLSLPPLSILCLLTLFVCAFGAESSALAQRRKVSVSKRTAQTKNQKEKSKIAAQEKESIAKARNMAPPNPTTERSTPTAIAVVNQPEADYLSGEANVSVNPKQPVIVRLGLARNATSVVEFPAVDSVYYIHEGNPSLVAVFQSPTKETDRSITPYPGEAFFPAPKGKSPSVTVTLQMKSGLVIVLEIIPAPDIASNAHRCVLNYNLAEVVAARRAAGLRVNLGAEDAQTSLDERGVRASSRLVANSAGGADNSKPDDDNFAASSAVFVEIEAAAKGRDARNDKRKTKSGSALTRLVNKKLAEAVKSPARMFANWTRSHNGLSVSTAKIVEIDDLQRALLIAVKNETTDTLYLLPAQPEMQIQTVDEAGKALQIERLESKYVESTAANGAIPGGATVYYAVVFDAPVLGANQKLRVLAAHRSAADAPATAELNKNGRENGKQ